MFLNFYIKVRYIYLFYLKMNEIKCNTTDQTWHAVANNDSV